MFSLTAEQIGLTLNLTGTFILSIGLIKSNKQIDLESGTYYGRNRFLADSLRSSRVQTIIGLIIVAIGFVLPLIIDPNRTFILDSSTTWVKSIIELVLVFLGVYLGFRLNISTERKRERESYFQLLLALGAEVSGNQQHFSQITANINIVNLLSLEVLKFYLNNNLTYKFGGVTIPEVWSYAHAIRRLKNISREQSDIDDAKEKTRLILSSIETAKLNITK